MQTCDDLNCVKCLLAGGHEHMFGGHMRPLPSQKVICPAIKSSWLVRSPAAPLLIRTPGEADYIIKAQVYAVPVLVQTFIFVFCGGTLPLLNLPAGICKRAPTRVRVHLTNLYQGRWRVIAGPTPDVDVVVKVTSQGTPDSFSQLQRIPGVLSNHISGRSINADQKLFAIHAFGRGPAISPIPSTIGSAQQEVPVPTGNGHRGSAISASNRNPRACSAQ